MEPKRVFLLSLTALLGLCLTINGVDSIGCYSCAGDLTTEAGKACADLTNIGVNGTWKSCYTRTSFSRGKPPAINRGGENPITPYDSSCDLTSCTCSTQACNSQKVKVPILSCYKCSTSEMISTGCGEGSDWSEGSIYVTQVTGCHACTKKTTAGGQIIRGCSYSALSTNRCDYDSTGSLCYCTGSLCNSAPSLLSSHRNLLLVSLITVFSGWLLS